MLVLINNSRTAWPTEILMSNLSFSDNLLQDDYIIFQKHVDHFEIEAFFGLVAFPQSNGTLSSALLSFLWKSEILQQYIYYNFKLSCKFV